MPLVMCMAMFALVFVVREMCDQKHLLYMNNMSYVYFNEYNQHYTFSDLKWLSLHNWIGHFSHSSKTTDLYWWFITAYNDFRFLTSLQQ